MPPEDSIVTDPVEASTIAAPRREKRLTPVAPAPKRPPAAARVRVAPAAAKPALGSVVERKVAALRDPEEMLNLVRTEATLRRAQRLSGAGDAQRQTVRLLSVFMLFALLVAALGAMWYLQTSLQGSRRGSHHAPLPAGQNAPAGR